ncbi:MAG: Ig-like domain-containing protein [Gemmatimonadales bacterium]
MPVVRSAMIAGLVLGLAACGGTTEPGGPLQVVNVSPASLAANVPVADTITITFSKALLPSSVSDSTIVLSYNGLRVIGTWALSADARSVSIIPRLGNNQFYVLEVRTDVKDAAGVALAEPYVTAFSTVAAGQVDVVDPKGDTYNAAFPDATSFSVGTAADTLTIRLGFASPISASTSGLANAVGGYIDLDTDQDPTTGAEAITDAFGPPGTQSGLGIEYYVVLFVDPLGRASIVNIQTGAITGLVSPTFGDSSMTLRIPLAMLGNDDGNMNVAATVGSVSVPTDVVPNVGHLTLGTSGQVGGKRSSAALSVGQGRGARIGAWGR